MIDQLPLLKPKVVKKPNRSVTPVWLTGPPPEFRRMTKPDGCEDVERSELGIVEIEAHRAAHRQRRIQDARGPRGRPAKREIGVGQPKRRSAEIIERAVGEVHAVDEVIETAVWRKVRIVVTAGKIPRLKSEPAVISAGRIFSDQNPNCVSRGWDSGLSSRHRFQRHSWGRWPNPAATMSSCERCACASAWPRTQQQRERRQPRISDSSSMSIPKMLMRC